MNTIEIQKLPFRTDPSVQECARIGLVILASDYTVEHEFRRVFTELQHLQVNRRQNNPSDPPASGIEFFTARIANSPQVTTETLADMQSRITATTELILPGDTLDVVAYCCTSASVVLGEQAVFDRLSAAQPDAKFTTPITATMASLRELKANRIVVLTPYQNQINEQIAVYLSSAGFDVACFGSFDEEMDPVVAGIDAASIEAGIEQLLESVDDASPVEAVFVSCTSIRLLHALDAIEEKIGLPVITSNQALIWHCLQLAGRQATVTGSGGLLTSISDRRSAH